MSNEKAVTQLSPSIEIVSDMQERLQSQRNMILERLNNRRDDRSVLSSLIETDELCLNVIDNAIGALMQALPQQSEGTSTASGRKGSPTKY